MIQCANCKSYKTKVENKQYLFMVGILSLLMGSLFLLFGIFSETVAGALFFPIAAGLIIVGIYYVVKALAHKKIDDNAKCKSCGNKWKLL